MRVLVLAFGVTFATTSALAQAVIGPCDAQKHVGEMVTVEGTVSKVAKPRSTTFINMGGIFPNGCFTGVIFADDASKFPGVDALTGNTVHITGRIKTHDGLPEIILNDPTQLK